MDNAIKKAAFSAQRVRIEILGKVQGVGFRPFVYNLARSFHLQVTVQNTSSGVIIDVEGKEEAIPTVFEKLTPEQEKAWFRMAHNRFRKAIAEKDLKEKQAKFRLLIKMVELGKRAVENDMEKSVPRKEYEISLWDRFYEDEYLALNTE